MRARGLLTLVVLFTLAGLTINAGPQQPPQAPPTTASGVICKWGGTGQIPDSVDEQDICCACTSIPVGKDASVDGSTMTSHSCDGHYEFQIHIVAGRKNAPGTMRPVMKGGGLGQDRPQAVKVGEIPDIEQTFTRYDASYSFMNEKQLGMGETTIGGRQELYNDEGWFDIMELQRVALERTASARDAIRLMGELATKYGYGDAGECLTVVDPNEVWQFEIFGAGPAEKGAVWAARRIPDGQVGVSANHSRLGVLDFADEDHVMASANVTSVAREMGFWKEGQPFDFSKAYGGPPSYGSTRREWRVLSTMAPSLKLDPWDQNLPFSVKPERKVGPRDLMALHRDSYEGTEFDMTQGLAAGPFGNPNRWSTTVRPPQGSLGWERPISIFRCSYATVIQTRGWLPSWIGGLVWFAQDDPKTSVYVPLYAGLTRLPESYEIGTRAQFDRRVAWWAFNFVSNWAQLRYDAMIEDIRKTSNVLEDGFFALQPDVEKRAVELYKQDPEKARAYITDYSNLMASGAVAEWWKLSDFLIMKYNDGYINVGGRERSAGYPKEWLDAVGYGTTKIPEKKK
ncbi:MAG: C69 family dipeptidase [Acidobacteriota bacterium]